MNIFIATGPTVDGDAPVEYMQLQERGEILHVHEEGGVTRVLTRTLGGAEQVAQLMEDGACVVSVARGVLCRVGRDGHGQQVTADLHGLADLKDRENLYALSQDEAFFFLHAD